MDTAKRESAQERESAREHVERWKRVGPELAAIRRRELREYSFEKSRDLVDDLLQMSAEHARPRKSSGLGKLHALLAKAFA